MLRILIRIAMILSGSSIFSVWIYCIYMSDKYRHMINVIEFNNIERADTYFAMAFGLFLLAIFIVTGSIHCGNGLQKLWNVGKSKQTKKEN